VTRDFWPSVFSSINFAFGIIVIEKIHAKLSKSVSKFEVQNFSTYFLLRKAMVRGFCLWNIFALKGVADLQWWFEYYRFSWRIWRQMRNGFRPWIRTLGGVDSWKKPRVEIPCYCPFKCKSLPCKITAAAFLYSILKQLGLLLLLDDNSIQYSSVRIYSVSINFKHISSSR
jgi:hypothetical protein